MEILPVSEVVPRTGYPDSDDDLASLFEGFESRVIDQHDYNSLLSWASMALHGREEVPVTLVEPLRRLVLSRSSFPDIGRQDWDWGRLASGVAAAHELEIANVILDLVENGLILIGGEQESTVLRRVLFMNTVEVWGEVGRRIEGGSWRVSLGARRWLLDGVEAEPILDWVGDSADRASLVADMAPIGRPAPTKLVQALFAKFQDESAVRSGFYGDLVSGSWVGNESDRIAGQIELLNGWRDDTSIAPEFRRWSGEVVESLLVSKSQAEQREAERDF